MPEEINFDNTIPDNLSNSNNNFGMETNHNIPLPAIEIDKYLLSIGMHEATWTPIETDETQSGTDNINIFAKKLAGIHDDATYASPASYRIPCFDLSQINLDGQQPGSSDYDDRAPATGCWAWYAHAHNIADIDQLQEELEKFQKIEYRADSWEAINSARSSEALYYREYPGILPILRATDGGPPRMINDVPWVRWDYDIIYQYDPDEPSLNREDKIVALPCLDDLWNSFLKLRPIVSIDKLWAINEELNNDNIKTNKTLNKFEKQTGSIELFPLSTIVPNNRDIKNYYCLLVEFGNANSTKGEVNSPTFNGCADTKVLMLPYNDDGKDGTYLTSTTANHQSTRMYARQIYTNRRSGEIQICSECLFVAESSTGTKKKGNEKTYSNSQVIAGHTLIPTRIYGVYININNLINQNNNPDSENTSNQTENSEEVNSSESETV